VGVTSAVVVGGSRGIGAAVVERLAGAGAAVADLDLDPVPGPAKISIGCDVADEPSVIAAVRQAREALGKIDTAVISAGVGGASPILRMTAEEWDRVHTVNSRGVFLCVRELAKAMTEDGQAGSIVVITSVSARSAERTMAHYSSSKAAAEALVRVAARELGPKNIRVNAVAPGTTDTPLFAQTDLLPGYRDRVSKRAALGTVGEASDVADAVLAVLNTPWVTGQVLVADGGLSLWSPLDPTERD
jgi:NAD(P)-dependent dehydrogenase (short-subunit alcohol dehydrogenase family)